MDFFIRQILDVIWGAKKAFCWKASLSVGDISMLLFRMMKVTVRWRCSGGILALTFNLVKRFVRIFFLITTLIELNDMYDFLWRRQWQPTSVLLPGKSQGRRSLVGYSPWGRDRTWLSDLPICNSVNWGQVFFFSSWEPAVSFCHVPQGAAALISQDSASVAASDEKESILGKGRSHCSQEV